MTPYEQGFIAKAASPAGKVVNFLTKTPVGQRALYGIGGVAYGTALQSGQDATLQSKVLHPLVAGSLAAGLGPRLTRSINAGKFAPIMTGTLGVFGVPSYLAAYGDFGRSRLQKNWQDFKNNRASIARDVYDYAVSDSVPSYLVQKGREILEPSLKPALDDTGKRLTGGVAGSVVGGIPAWLLAQRFISEPEKPKDQSLESLDAYYKAKKHRDFKIALLSTLGSTVGGLVGGNLGAQAHLANAFTKIKSTLAKGTTAVHSVLRNKSAEYVRGFTDKAAFIGVSWGGGGTGIAPKYGPGLEVGYSNLFGVLPIPQVSTDIGGPEHGLILGGPIPTIGLRVGHRPTGPYGWRRVFPRGLPEVAYDKAKGQSLDEAQVLQILDDIERKHRRPGKKTKPESRKETTHASSK
jgi:hypothetical protein